MIKAQTRAIMDRASAELERRTKKAMLYSKLKYSEVRKRVLQADTALVELYAKGYVSE